MSEAINAITTNNISKEEFTKADSALSKFTDDFDNFLKIFVTQLNNQDPLEPQDSSAFTDQIASLSGVEQAVQSNKNLEEILKTLNGSNANDNVIAYSGKYVEVPGDEINFEGQGTDVDFSYNLNEAAKQIFIEISNPDNGQIIYNNEGGIQAGKNIITWNGLDNDGNIADAGKYNVKVTQINEEGNNIGVPTIVKGKVDGVNLVGGNSLLVNGQYVQIEDVEFVGES